jgi:hypothetical protein
MPRVAEWRRIQGWARGTVDGKWPLGDNAFSGKRGNPGGGASIRELARKNGRVFQLQAVVLLLLLLLLLVVVSTETLLKSLSG